MSAAPFTLVEALMAQREVPRGVTYITSNTQERRVSYGEIEKRAMALLRPLQAVGANAGSELVLFLDNNEQFVDAFWACMLGRIAAVPLAPGNADEHRFKLFHVMSRLLRPHLCTDRKLFQRITSFAEANGLAS